GRALREARTLGPLEGDLALDEAQDRVRVRGERVAVPDDEVAVLPDLDRARAPVDPELLRRVDRDERERLLLGEAAVAHALRGLEEEVPDELARVRVDRRHDPGPGADRGVRGDRVHDLDLVGPPVGERRAAGAVLLDLGRDLVALEDVLERRDLDAELVADAEERDDL